MRSSERPREQPMQDGLAPWLVAMAEFVHAQTHPTVPRHVPEITLRLSLDLVPLWDRIERDTALRGGPPYWALAWPAGLALARHLLDNPALVAGRRVLDFAAGSGLVGIAAAKCGAARVTAYDIDPLATIAILLNAEANGVEIAARPDNLLAPDSRFDPTDVDVVLAGDICYEPNLAKHGFALLERCRAAGCLVLIGDPGRPDLPTDRLTRLSAHEVPVTPLCQYVAAGSGDGSEAPVIPAAVWTFPA